MRKTLQKLILILFILIGQFSYGQNKRIEQGFVLMDKYYRSADYKTGFIRSNDYLKLIRRKCGAESLPMARMNAYKALFKGSLSKFEEYNEYLTNAENIFNTSKADNYKEYILAANAITEAYFLVGYYQKAEQLQEKVKLVASQHEGTYEANIAGYYFLQTKYFQGYYNLVMAEINNRCKLAEAGIVAKDSVPDKTGKMIYGKLPAYQQAARKKLYSDCIFLKVAIYKANGWEDSCLTLLDKHFEWVKQNFSYKEGILPCVLYEQAMLALDNDDISLSGKYLRKASGASAKYYKIHAPINSRIQGAYINNLRQAGKTEEATSLNNNLDVKVISYYGRRSLAYLNNNLIDTKRLISIGSIKRASKDLNDYLKPESYFPEIHQDRIAALLELFKLNIKAGELDKAEKNLTSAIQLKKDLCGEESPAYHQMLLELAKFYVDFADNYKDAAAIYVVSLDKIVGNNISHYCKTYYNYVFDEAKLYEVTEKYDAAYKLIDGAKADIEAHNGKTTILYAIVLARSANLDIELGHYNEAEKKLNQAISIAETDLKDRNRADYAQILETKVRLNIVLGDYENANAILNKSYAITKKTGDDQLNFSSSVEELAVLNIYFGRYQETEDALNKIIIFREGKFGHKHHSLINPLNQLGNLKTVTGNYNEAEKDLQTAASISKDLYGEKSVKYSESLILLRALYTSMGDYDKAEKAIQKVVDKQTELFGANSIRVGSSLHQLALAKFYSSENSKSKRPQFQTSSFDEKNTRGGVSRSMKTKTKTADPLLSVTKEEKSEDAEALFNRSLTIIKSVLGENNPTYAEALEDASIYYLQTNNLNLATEYIDKAKAIWISKLGEQNIHSAKINFIKGNIYYLNENYKDALTYFVKARSLYQILFDENHPSYIESQGMCAEMYYILGDTKAAVESSEETIKKSLQYIDKIFPGLSEREKANYWEKVNKDFQFYYTLAFTQQDKYPDMIGNVYDITLRTKAILLNNSLKVRQTILNSGDTSLINNFQTWLGLKESLTSAISLSTSQRNASGIDVSDIESKIEALEKKLSERSSAFSKNYRNRSRYEWKTLKKTLKEDEVALEVIPFRLFDKKFTDTTWYAVLAVRASTSQNPEFVLIKNGKELDTKFIKYYRNCIKFEIDDEKSYEAFWKPFISLIKNDNEKIYLSVDGAYNQINIESVLTPEGKYLIEKNNIVLIGSTRDLIDRYYEKKSQPSKANRKSAAAQKQVVLVGNPTYYTSMIQSDRKIDQLPGAEVEVNQLKTLLESKSWSSKIYIEDAATEEKVKSVNSPNVFHIATHGFFLEDEQEDEFDEVTEKAVHNPLLRSGLLMVNGGQLLQSEYVYAFNKEDGILTAYEAMNLNLDGTDLVVLSACETGLGEVKLGEGVFGLQRSFLVAGAGSIVMSLFKVSDEVTTELMSIFYAKWISTGNKRQSFIDAKKDIMAKYKSPKYWGAFLMVGAE